MRSHFLAGDLNIFCKFLLLPDTIIQEWGELDMINSGNCGLVIRGYDLNFDEIENNLEIKPSKVAKVGDCLSKVVGESEYDLWRYEIKLDSEKTINQILKELLDILNPSKEYIHNIARYADVRVKCYVQSDYAQISFEFLPDVIEQLSSMGIVLEVSTLSWGGVSDNTMRSSVPM